MGNRKGTSGKLRVLVDTTFLLPALGFSIEEEAEEIIPLFRKVEVFYLEIGLVEAMWKIIKLVPPQKLSRVELGIEAIRRTYHLLEPPPSAYVTAIQIYDEGHKDYVDALYYATARACNVSLLTIDYSFIDFLKERNYKVEGVVVTPKILKSIVK